MESRGWEGVNPHPTPLTHLLCILYVYYYISTQYTSFLPYSRAREQEPGECAALLVPQVYVLSCLFPRLSRSVRFPNTDPISESQRIGHSCCYTHPRPMPQLRNMLVRALSTIPEPHTPPPAPSNARPIPAASFWVNVPKSDTFIWIQSSRLISEQVVGMCSGTPIVGLICIQPAPRHWWKGGREVPHFVAVLCCPKSCCYSNCDTCSPKRAD
jgi:hypothetical protein